MITRPLLGIYPFSFLASLCFCTLNARTLMNLMSVFILQVYLPRRLCDPFVLRSSWSALGKETLTYQLLSSLPDIIKILDKNDEPGNAHKLETPHKARGKAQAVDLSLSELITQ